MRHAPFAINVAARDAWLTHMRAALDELHLPAEQERTLWQYLASAADAMRNTPG
jgi:hemoglobin